MSFSKKTIEYYNKNAKVFFENTYKLNMQNFYNPFLKLLSKKAKILDAGCGSGRDSLHFKKLGYEVVAFDASLDMVNMSSEYTGIEVQHLDFHNVDYQNEFDGIWACASLLHISKSELCNVLEKLCIALTETGVIYISFKYGENEGVQNERFFNNYTEKNFTTFINNFPKMILYKLWLTTDLRKNRFHEKWINILLKKC